MKKLYTNKNFLNLYISQSISSFGDWVSYIILTLIIYKNTNNEASIAILLICKLAPSIFLLKSLKFISTNFNIKKVMFFSDLFRFILFFGYIYVDNIIIIYIITILISICSLIFNSLKNSIISNILEDDLSEIGNSQMASVCNLMMIIGPIIGGVFYSLFGGSLCLFINALTFLISSIFVMKINLPNKLKDFSTIKSSNKNNKLKLSTISPIIINFLCINSIIDGVYGSLNTIIPILSEKFNNSSFIYGIIASLLGVDMLLGGLTAPIISKKYESIKSYIMVTIIAGLFLIIFGYTTNLVLLFICVIIFSFCNGVQEVNFSTYLQKNAKQNLVEVFSLSL